MTPHVIIGAVFVIYIAGMLAIGVLAFRRTHTLLDYLLGGRRLGAFVAALSACASDMSGWLLLGLPGAIFVAGLSGVWIGVGLLVGSYLNWLLVARPLRRESERLGAMTVSEYFARRFADRGRTLRLITAVFTLLFLMVYTTSGLVASGKLFEGVFGLDYRIAVVVGSLAIIAYTSMGGFLAVCLTDAIQGVLMLCALLLVPWMAVRAVGGMMSCWEQIGTVSPDLLRPFGGGSGAIGLLALVSTLGWGLGYFGMPHIIVRFMAIKHEDRIPRARQIAVVWTALSLGASIAVGLAAIAFFGGHVTGDSERVFIYLIQDLFHPIPAGLCLAAILAAIMSTADSQLLVCTSAITEDIYRTFLKRDAQERELVYVGRVAVVVTAIVAAAMAFDPESKVMRLVAYAWAGFGAAFGPAMIVSLYWKRMSTAGAIAGMVGGGVTVVIWKHLSGGLFNLYEIVPGFLVSLVLIAAFSYVVPGHREETT